MKKLYASLAATNLKNNKQFYVPYLLTGILMTAMFYTMNSILESEGINSMPGAAELKSIFGFGTFIIGLFVFIFLFYTNSFIMKRRTRELGIYNILGMEKRHIAKILALETGFSALVSVGGGLFFGIIFNKFLMMFLYKLISFSSPIQFYISWKGMTTTLILFGIIFLFILCYNLLRVRISNPMELLRSGNAGEKEPKTKWLLTIIGAVSIIVAYYIAITTTNPIKALQLFFLAVFLVILGTYCLFTAGSITFLKMLRKNKNFYYQSKHFSAVSGMIYRMKQNAVGLSNICILSTMVLVMVSTTVCMFAGTDDELKARYPSEVNVTAQFSDSMDHNELIHTVEETINEQGRMVTDKSIYTSFNIMSMMDGDTIQDKNTWNNESWQDSYIFEVMTYDQYEAMTGETLPEIGEGEVILSGVPDYEYQKICAFGNEYTVKECISEVLSQDSYMQDAVAGYYYLIMPDADSYDTLYQAQRNTLGEDAAEQQLDVSMDISGTKEEKLLCDQAILGKITDLRNNGGLPGYIGVYMEGRESNRSSFLATYGGMFFLGIFLGVMFLMVTVLIIFYKQISEGYEDKERYIIMEKVGMSASEVKKSINSQIRTVFLLPILTAGVHVAAAFPMIKKMLALLNLTNSALFGWCLAGTILVFTMIYLLVFYITSKSYYKIVGNQVK